jgi:hypothetical protein
VAFDFLATVPVCFDLLRVRVCTFEYVYVFEYVCMYDYIGLYTRTYVFMLYLLILFNDTFQPYRLYCGGTRWRSWLRHYATRRKVAGSSQDEVNFFNLPNPSSRTMALGLTQPLTEMRGGGKGRPARTADNLTAICEPTV